jgi:hypothetical protein
LLRAPEWDSYNGSLVTLIEVNWKYREHLQLALGFGALGVFRVVGRFKGFINVSTI